MHGKTTPTQCGQSLGRRLMPSLMAAINRNTNGKYCSGTSVNHIETGKKYLTAKKDTPRIASNPKKSRQLSVSAIFQAA